MELGICILTNEGVGSNNIKSGHTKNSVGIVHTSLLEDLSGDGNGGVNRVGDDGNHSLGADLGGSLSKVSNNRSVGVEQIISEMIELKILLKF